MTPVGMGNAFLQRQIFQAAYRFGETRTVEEVIAEHDARSEERRKGDKAPGKKAKVAGTTAPMIPKVTKGSKAQLDALIAQAAAAKALREPDLG